MPALGTQDPDSIQDSPDHMWFHIAYDAPGTWRSVAFYKEDGADPTERFVYHNAGLDGQGSASYSDRMILRDLDTSADGESAALDAEQRRDSENETDNAKLSRLFGNHAKQIIAWACLRMVYTCCASFVLMVVVAMALGGFGVLSHMYYQQTWHQQTWHFSKEMLFTMIFVGGHGVVAGVFASPVVAVLAFRRRPIQTVSVVYAVLFLLFFCDAPFLSNINVNPVIPAALYVVACTLVSAVLWAIWDAVRGHGIWYEFTLAYPANRCRVCGYILYSTTVMQCSECGATPAGR